MAVAMNNNNDNRTVPPSQSIERNSPIHSSTFFSIPGSINSIHNANAHTSWKDHRYVRLSWTCYAVAMTSTLLVFGALLLVGSLSVKYKWPVSEEVVEYCDLTAMLVVVSIFAAIGAFSYTQRDRDIIKARGYTFLCVILISGCIAAITMYLASMQYHFIWNNWPIGWTYATLAVAKLARSCFIGAVLSRQRLICLAFTAFKVRDRSKYEFEKGVVITMLLSIVAMIPFTLIFFNPTSYPFYMFYIGEVVWASILIVAFGYYTYQGRNVGPRFADFYQNVRMFMFYPMLFYIGVYVEIHYKFTPIAAFFYYYASTIPVVVYMLDSFGFIVYVIYKGVDCEVPMERTGTGSAMSRKSSKITNFTIPVPDVRTIETITELSEAADDTVQTV